MSGPGKISLVVTGSKELNAYLKKATGNINQATRCATYALGVGILGSAVRRAPKKRGVLRGSGFCTLPVGKGTAWESTVGFGGPAKAYAWAQHEGTNFRHREGEDHYLQKAVDEVGPQAASIFLSYVKQALETEGGPPAVKAIVPKDADETTRKAEEHAKKQAAKAQRRAAVHAKRLADRTARKAKRDKARARKKAFKKALKGAKKGAKKAAKSAKSGAKKALKAGKRTVKRAAKGAKRGAKKAAKAVKRATRTPRRRK